MLKLFFHTLWLIALLIVVPCKGNNTPTITFDNFPADITVTCPNDIPDISTDITATTDCESGATVFFVSETYTGLENKPGFCPSQVIRIYKASDQCGDWTEGTHTITVASDCGCLLCQDKVPHIFVDLRNDPNAVWETGWFERDGLCCDAPGNENCLSITVYLHKDAVMLEVVDVQAPSYGAEGLKIDCETEEIFGKEINIEEGGIHVLTICKPGKERQNIRITQISVDNSPILICPNDVFFEGCNSQDLEYLSNLPFATTPKSITKEQLIEVGGSVEAPLGIAEITYHDISDWNMCPTTVQRTFTVTDNAIPSHSVSCSQTIHIEDTTPPVFSAPADVTIDCDMDVTDLLQTGDVIYEVENCSVNLDAVYSDFKDSENPCDYTIIRTWILTDECGNIATAVQIITVVPSTGIDQANAESNLQIYPNPSTGTFTLEYTSEPGKFIISVSDITGREVYKELFTDPGGEINEIIDLSEVGPGVYFLRLISENGVHYQRLIVE